MPLHCGTLSHYLSHCYIVSCTTLCCNTMYHCPLSPPCISNTYCTHNMHHCVTLLLCYYTVAHITLCYYTCIHANTVSSHCVTIHVYMQHVCYTQSVPPLYLWRQLEINVTRLSDTVSQRRTCFLHHMCPPIVHTSYTYIYIYIYKYIYYIYIYTYTFHTTIAVDLYGRHHVPMIVGRQTLLSSPFDPTYILSGHITNYIRNIPMYSDT